MEQENEVLVGTNQQEAAEGNMTAAEETNENTKTKEEGNEEALIPETPEPVEIHEVPKRPPKPHRDARPCPFWPKYYPGSPKLEEGDPPCQGHIADPNAKQCHNCHTAERYGPEPEEESPRITLEVLQRILDAAKKFFAGVTEEFKRTPMAGRAAALLSSALRAFEQGPERYNAAYLTVQEAVPLLLALEASWLEKRLRAHAREVGQEAKLSERIDKAAREYATALSHARIAAQENGRAYPRWVPAFDLREGYRKIILPRKQRKQYINGFQEVLDGYSSGQGNGNKERR